VESIEATEDGYLTLGEWKVLGHMFMPMGTTWNGIDQSSISNVWTEEQAINWKSRVLQSGGAWTWNIPREAYYDPNNPSSTEKMSILREDFVVFLNNVTDRMAPSDVPSLSQSPSVTPSSTPSTEPSQEPSASPSQSPSAIPSSIPSSEPSMLPTQLPSNTPSAILSVEPSTSPSEIPSVEPSTSPSETLSAEPSASPSSAPSDAPSDMPSVAPSTQPNVSPSTEPSLEPSGQPSTEPSATPSSTGGDDRLDCSSHQCGNGNREKWEVCMVGNTGVDVSKCKRPDSQLFDGGDQGHYCGACDSVSITVPVTARLDCSAHPCGNQKWEVCKVGQTGVEVSKCKSPNSDLFRGVQEHYCGPCD